MSPVTIRTDLCRVCNNVTPGTDYTETDGRCSDFVCANCDSHSFEREAERQKSSYLAGAKFDQHEVY